MVQQGLKICINVSINDENSLIPPNVVEKFKNIDLIVTNTEEFVQKVKEFLADILDDSQQPVDTWKSAMVLGSPYKSNESE